MRLRLNTRYALILLGLTLAVVLALSVVQYLEIRVAADDIRDTTAESMDEALLRQYQQRAVGLSTALSSSLVNAIYRLDIEEIENIVSGLATLPDLGGVAVLDGSGLLYLEGSIPGFTADESAVAVWSLTDELPSSTVAEFLDKYIVISTPVKLADQTIGHVVLSMSLMPIQHELVAMQTQHDRRVSDAMGRVFSTSAQVAAVAAIFCILLAFIVGGRLSRPITSLSLLARRVGDGDFRVPDVLGGPGEVGELASSFVAMAHNLRRTTVSNAYLDGILNSMLDGLVVTSADGLIRKVNAATCSLLNLDEARLIGQPIARFLDVDWSPTDGRQPSEGLARCANGETLPVLISSAELAMGQDGTRARVWVFRDITRIRQSQDDLLDAKKEAEKANEAKSQFLANMSHELRTPLNAVLGFSELIIDGTYGEVPPEIFEAMGRIERNGQHLLGLINDVLDLSKIEAGRLTLSLQQYDMADVVRTVGSSLSPLAVEKQISLACNIPPDLPLGWGDAGRITQALMNLVGNALKFTESGDVTVGVVADEDWFTVSVVDSGPGISEADQQVIFDEFYQLDGSITRRQGGTGLGLAIAKRMIEMHGGRLWVESTLGAGADFRFTVPLRVDRQTEAA
jgi:PAS domain S-box-containing protein